MIADIVRKQNTFFASGKTQDIAYRITYLKAFEKALAISEDRICEALYQDFKKPVFETLATETQMVLAELRYIINHLEFWSKPQKVRGSLANFPSANWIFHHPYGKVLIMAPWNYPVLLTLSPLIGALAAGNTVVLKPSELCPNTSRVVSKLVEEVFPQEYVVTVEGGVDVSKALLEQPWDYIFFTGSTQVGKNVYQSAAKYLTPVTLELGGKNPCIVDETANINLAAKRIAWGKFINAGQTCVAPDYILVHKSVKEALINALMRHIQKFYGDPIIASPDFARIATRKHYETLKEKMLGENIIYGGHYDDDSFFVEPTLIDEPSLDSKLMQEEVFGPILPIISYTSEEEISPIIHRHEKPLSLYVFSSRKKFQKKAIQHYGFGGGVINDVVMHIANKQLPFGGVGDSGIGTYHGKYSFETFSYKKSIVKKPIWLDIPLRYPPYKWPIGWAKHIKRLI